MSQGGITCGAIDEPRKSSKAIDERAIINFHDKNVVIARFRDKNIVIARFRDKTAYVWMGILPLKKRVNCDKCSFATKQRMFGVFAIDEILRYRGTRFPGSRTLCHPGVTYDLENGPNQSENFKNYTDFLSFISQYLGGMQYSITIHTCKKREIVEIYLRNFFWIFRKILG